MDWGTGRTAGQVFTTDAAGKHRRMLTRPPSWRDTVRWSPHGTRLLYLDHGNEDKRLFPFLMVMGAGGRHKHKLLGGPNRQIEDFDWGPGGRSILVSMTINHGNTATSDLFRYSMATGKLSRLHINVPKRRARAVDWSKDGRLIVFEGVTNTDDQNISGAQLYVVRPNGTGLRQLTTSTSTGIFDGSPRWSPNGKQVLYSRANEDGGCAEALFVINADGTNRKRIPVPCGAYLPDWFPSGTRVLFTAGYTKRSWVIAANVDGTARKRLIPSGAFASWRPQ